MAKLEVFKVPNDAPGRKFIRELKKYLNRSTYKVRVRGRHSDRKKLYARTGETWRDGWQNDVKLKHAETFGVYLDFKNSSGWQTITDELQDHYMQAETNANIGRVELRELLDEQKRLEREILEFKVKADKYAGTGVGVKPTNISRKIRLNPENKNDNKK